jgi:hypothetical protein
MLPHRVQDGVTRRRKRPVTHSLPDCALSFNATAPQHPHGRSYRLSFVNPEFVSFSSVHCTFVFLS